MKFHTLRLDLESQVLHQTCGTLLREYFAGGLGGGLDVLPIFTWKAGMDWISSSRKLQKLVFRITASLVEHVTAFTQH